MTSEHELHAGMSGLEAEPFVAAEGIRAAIVGGELHQGAAAIPMAVRNTGVDILWARAYPATEHERVVLVIDNAPWHRGAVVTEMLARHRHLELSRLPSYSPEQGPIERLCKLLRHRVTHNRLFETLFELTPALGRTLRAPGRRKRQLLSLIMSQRKRAKSSTT